jgi:hypothetical protein
MNQPNKPAKADNIDFELSQRQLSKAILIQALVICILLGFCGFVSYQYFSIHNQHAIYLNQTVFQRSINDAALLDDSKVVNTLFALNPNNRSLVYKQIDGREHVKAVAWMSNDTFTNYYLDENGSLKSKSQSPPVNIALNWVTLVPQVRSFCQALAYDDPSFRIKQFLGLDPNRAYEQFVEIWVEPKKVFRPCIDSDPTDASCELPSRYTGLSKVDGIDDYKAFFESLKSSSYTPQGAPWTRLGYTYDWAKGQRGIGASEYVLVPDSTFYIDRHFSTKEYCR